MQPDRAAQKQRLAELATGLLDEEPTPMLGIKSLIDVGLHLAQFLPLSERTFLSHHLIDQVTTRLNPRRH